MTDLVTPGELAPRTSRRKAAVTVLVGLAATGAIIGVLWAWAAPAVHGVIALSRSGNRVHAYLGHEADHFFVAAFLMLGMLTVVAIVAPVLVWQWRAHRGPLMVVALSLGAVAAAAVATGVGAALARWRFGVVDIDGAPVTPENRVEYFAQAPSVFFGHTPLQMAATLVLPAATAALVYALMAVATSRDDLGAFPAVDPPRPYPVIPQAPVSVEPHA